MMEMEKSDYKILKNLQQVALDRFCKEVLDEVTTVADKHRDSPHEGYLKLWQLLRARDKTIGRSFDGFKRSEAIIHVMNMVDYKLLTDEEYKQFSEETRSRIEGLLKLRHS